MRIFIPGNPAPQGSKRHIGNGRMIESSKRVAPWRSDVRSALYDAHGGRPMMQGAVAVEMEFILYRPMSAPKKRTPPAMKKPDIDKLTRAILDAVTSAGVWRDDSQVVELNAQKRLAGLDEPPGCWLQIDDLSPKKGITR